jgi:5'-deoxy-5'-methylthioadenosine phosphorylase
MSNYIGIIGGTGLTSLEGLEIVKREKIETPYGDPSDELIYGKFADKDVLFLPRHGSSHTIPPHKINYRANIWALKNAGVDRIVAVAAVGGIRADMTPAAIMLPDQIVDYTWGRIHTYFEEGLEEVTHIDFSYPYTPSLREKLIKACAELKMDVAQNGTYAATQGPRLETAAEINKYERDGCDIVGMTAMPEAALARELELDYAAITVVANEAAGRCPDDLTMEMIEQNLQEGMEKVRSILRQALTIL